MEQLNKRSPTSSARRCNTESKAKMVSRESQTYTEKRDSNASLRSKHSYHVLLHGHATVEQGFARSGSYESTHHHTDSGTLYRPRALGSLLIQFTKSATRLFCYLKQDQGKASHPESRRDHRLLQLHNRMSPCARWICYPRSQDHSCST
jgi:hypothetical protein